MCAMPCAVPCCEPEREKVRHRGIVTIFKYIKRFKCQLTERERGRVGAQLEEDLVKTNQGETKLEQNKLAKLGGLNDTDMILLLSGANEILSSFGIFGQYRKTETSK